MDDFVALKNLKGLSLRNPSKDVENKDFSTLSTSSYVSSSTTQAIAASKRDSNLDPGPDAKSSSGSEEPFDYYNNAYQRYMAEHGGLNEDNDNETGTGDGEEDDEGFGYFGQDEDVTLQDEGRHSGLYSPIISPKRYGLGNIMSDCIFDDVAILRVLLVRTDTL